MSELDYLAGWHSGKWPGGTYGLRFGKLRDRLVEGRPDAIELSLEGMAPVSVDVTEGFWHQCPEVRDPQIGKWIVGQKLMLPWPAGKPPRFLVSRISRNCFRVARARAIDP